VGEAWNDLERGRTLKSADLRSPDGKVVVWSTGRIERQPLRRTPEGIERRVLHRSELVLRERTGPRIAIFKTQHRDGRLLGPSGQPWDEDWDYDEFCGVDWTPDSRLLLVLENVSILASDTGCDQYWVYDRSVKKPALVDTSGLQRRLKERYLQKLETVAALRELRDYRRVLGPSFDEGVDFHVMALGWDGGAAPRIVFRAEVAAPAEIFLGFWSVEPSGRDPRLVTEERAFEVRRFGTLSGAPPAPRVPWPLCP
jgi:hypothetical protein